MINITCSDPNTSILFDGVIPSGITDREGQLLCLNSHSTISFYVSSNISTFEINCFSLEQVLFRNDGNQVAAVGIANGIASCEHFLKCCFNAIIPIVNKFTLQPQNPQADIHYS